MGWDLVLGLFVAVGLALAIALLPLTWTVLLVLGGVVLLVTLVEPRLGLVFVVVAVPFGAIRQVRLGVMNVGLTEALVVLVAAAWLMRLALRREGVLRRAPRPALLWPLTIFIGVLLLSLLVTWSLQHSIKELIKWFEVLLLYLLVAWGVNGRWARVLAIAVVVTGALAALHGIYQFLFRVGPEGFVLFDRFMRAYGTFEQPNPYGGYLGLTLPLALGMVIVAGLGLGRWLRSWRWVALVVAGISAVLMLAALVMSWSRGAWLGFGAAVAGMAVALVVKSGRGAVLSAILAALVAYALLAGGLARVPPALVQRFSDFVPYLGVLDVRGAEITDANFAVLERVAHWQAAWQMWTDHPWLGVGIGNYEPVYPRYALPQWPLPLGHAHNYYLNVAAEAGILGLGAYLLLWGAALFHAWRAVRRGSGWGLGVALGVLGVMIHLGVHSFVDNLYVHGMYLQLAVLLGLVASVGSNQEAQPQ
ncbi:MAG: O-antigen ligase family protein [Anaerolineae bacterium]|nr:O-antigen ligase family protein [Anaerolineae bacterium]